MYSPAMEESHRSSDQTIRWRRKQATRKGRYWVSQRTPLHAEFHAMKPRFSGFSSGIAAFGTQRWRGLYHFVYLCMAKGFECLQSRGGPILADNRYREQARRADTGLQPLSFSYDGIPECVARKAAAWRGGHCCP